MQTLTVLGATGSIGASTLDVVARHPDRYRVFALTAHTQVDLLVDLCARFQPACAVVSNAALHGRLAQGLRDRGLDTEAMSGEKALGVVACAPHVDVVMAAIVGAAGLPSAWAAALSGKRLLLANKEALVMSGALFMQAVKKGGAQVLPIDSEHNALFQSLPRDYAQDPDRQGVRRLVLTASGGPFRSRPLDTLAEVTPHEACAHPNWSMGRKISVDSATMMNKGLEVIEAHWLFGVPPDRIDVLIHPQSLIHSMVEYVDGSSIAQLGHPDMRTPIAHALGFPERIEAGVGPLDLCKAGRLDFEAPDFARFPCLGLAYKALRAGGSAPAFLNAANEEAVAAFLTGQLRFTDIASLVSAVLETLPVIPLQSLDAVFEADQKAREKARSWIKARTP
jgi:1-deoxy-D-xylulose-5-phosphate reductoisomerase